MVRETDLKKQQRRKKIAWNNKITGICFSCEGRGERMLGWWESRGFVGLKSSQRPKPSDSERNWKKEHGQVLSTVAVVL